MQEQTNAERLQPVESTHGGAGEKCEEGGVIERSCYRLTATPHSPLPCAASSGREVEELRAESVKLSLGREGSMRGRYCFNLYLFLSILIYFNWQ